MKDTITVNVHVDSEKLKARVEEMHKDGNSIEQIRQFINFTMSQYITVEYE